MLEYMRKNANSSIVWLIIGAIAVVFIFFGVGGGGTQYKKITVNGEEVNPYDYERMLNAVARAQGGGGASGADKAIKLQAISELVSQILMNQFGRVNGLDPSDWALGQNIAAQPEFQVDGRFDRARYESELAAMRTDKVYFEQATRRELLASRINGLIGGLSQVFGPEALEMYRYQEDQLAFAYVFFPAETHRAGLSPAEDLLKSYYLLNQERWRRPAVMTVDYVELNPADFLDQVEINEAELMEVYGDNKVRFTDPESAEVSHILIKFPKMNPDEADRQATLERAEAAYERSRTEDFADLAREVSEDPGSASEGGSLGRISRGMTFDNFEKEAFSAPIGEVSRPVPTDIGYHLIKVISRQEAGARPFDEVKETLLNEQKAIRSREMAVTRLEDLLIRTETNPKLSEAASSMGLETKTSPSFSQDQPLEFFDKEEEELKKAFSLPLGKVSAVENENHIVVYSPVHRVDSHVPPLDEIRAEVTEDWTADTALGLARAEADAFLGRAGQEGWETAAEALPEEGPISRGSSPLLRRSAFMDNAPFNQADLLQFMAAINSVAKIGQISPLTVAGQESGRPGCFILMLSDYQAADESQFEGQMGDMFRMMMSMNKSNLLYQVWRGQLYDASKDNIIVPNEYL
jgi:Parvulin-like peptidyl-prolyl isomerase